MGETANDLMNGPAAVPDPARQSPDKALANWMQEIAPYGVFTTDTELRIRSWNQWLATYSRKKPSEVIGRTLAEVFPELEKRNLLRRYQHALAGEVNVLSAALHKYLLAFPSVMPDAGPLMLQTARIAPLPEEGRIGGTITLIEDVTQREFHAQTLSRQQELERLLANALAILLQAIDPLNELAGIFTSIVPTLGVDVHACYLLSSDGKTLELKASGGILPRQRLAIEKLPIEESELRSMRNPNNAEVDIVAHREAMEHLGVSSHQTFPLLVQDRFLGFVSFASYQQNRVGAGAVQVLSRLARYVAIALDRASRERDVAAASRAKDDFLAALSHELRTPLNPVLLLASDSATNPDFSDEARDAFRVIEKNVLLEARLIDDLLDLTRIERGKLNLESSIVDLHAVVRDALVTVRADIAQKSIRVDMTLTAGRSTVAGDAGRLQQVFWNVIRNAVKFNSVGGSITLASSERDGREIVIDITDTGLGMEPHELARIFNAFVQGDHADHGAHRFGGLGLGLAISKRLVELHSGRIEAKSRGKNQGSTFTIVLPLAVGEQSSKARQPAGATRTPFAAQDEPAVSRGILLLVEDHEATRNTLARLVKTRGYEVVATGSATEAKEKALEQYFDLVLSDIGLPDGDGYELMRGLHTQHGLRGVALTGYGMEEDMEKSRAAGFIAHLTKPISISVLEKTLAAAFRTPESQPKEK